jgi:hypothetical protein
MEQRMLKHIRNLAIIIVSIAVGGCGVSASKTSARTANNAVNELTYAKDERTGICYAVVSSSSALHVNDQGMTITYVPCDPKVIELIGK